MSQLKSGYVAIIGKPNVGKSTLMNYFLGKKISITSRKPQTTRHRILGIKTTDAAQIVFVDTPGLHFEQKHEINRIMNRAARNALSEADVVLFLIEAMRWDSADASVLRQLKEIQLPIILVVNKIDEIKQKTELLPFIENLSKQFNFKNIIPISAKTGLQVPELEKIITQLLPHTGNLFSPEQFTDQSDRFIAAEFMREKLMRLLGDEVPYELTVTIEAMEEEDNIIKISAIIWVARETQKAIVIGKNGSVLKEAGTQARKELEEYFSKKILLKSWVKVKSNWLDDERALHDLDFNP